MSFDWNASYEWFAEQFRQETGLMAPGKDDAMPSDMNERRKAWNEWMDVRREQAWQEWHERHGMLANAAPAPINVKDNLKATDGPLLEFDVLLSKFHAAVWSAATDEVTHPAYDEAGVEEAKAIQRHVRNMLATAALAVASDTCDQDVYKLGRSIGLFDIPKKTANAICSGVSAVTGARVDWHYVAGRVHMKALAAPAQAEQQGDGGEIADDIRRDLERSEWTPEEALRWYAAGKHFDVVSGRTRILDTGAIASAALKRSNAQYHAMKGADASFEFDAKLSGALSTPSESWSEALAAPAQSETKNNDMPT